MAWKQGLGYLYNTINFEMKTEKGSTPGESCFGIRQNQKQLHYIAVQLVDIYIYKKHMGDLLTSKKKKN